MAAPRVLGIYKVGRTFKVVVRSAKRPKLVLARIKTGDVRPLPHVFSFGKQHVFSIDFYGPDLYDITFGVWRIQYLKNGKGAKLRINETEEREYNFKQYTYLVRLLPKSGPSIKVTRAYEAVEETHEMRVQIKNTMYEKFRQLPLRERTVFFESFVSREYNDNPKAIYEEMRDRRLPYEMIWALENEKIDVGRHGKTVRFYTLKYWYYLATSKYIVSNMNQLSFVKREGQVVVQTMHGTPLKKMGLSVTGRSMKYARMEQLFQKDWDYFVTPSDFFSDILRGPSYGFTGEFLETGYPRNDVLVNNKDNAALIAQVKKTLGVPEGKKMILYAPTWRTKQRFDLKIDFEAMRAALGNEYVVVLRAHSLEARFVPDDVYSDFVLDGHGYSNVNDMLIAADVLVTDYSSIMFDYAIMLRPLILFTWDYDTYVDHKRGTYIDLKEEYPELIAMTNDELIAKFAHLDEVMTGVESFHERFNQYETGHAARDVVDKLFAKQ